MAVTVAQSDAIINACQTAGVRLSVGYRLHSEPYIHKKSKRSWQTRDMGTSDTFQLMLPTTPSEIQNNED